VWLPGFIFLLFSSFVRQPSAGDLEHERVVPPRETTRNNGARNNGVAVTIPTSGVSLSGDERSDETRGVTR